MTAGFFVTGTDTGVGKTVISALLMAALGPRAAYYKPVQTGDDDDTETVRELSGGFALPVGLRLPLPAAPWRAAIAAGVQIELSTLVARAVTPCDWLVAEGAGGVLVPLGPGLLMRDLISALGLPALVVARTQLGTINHTLLTVSALVQRGLPVAGIVLNGPPDPGLTEILHACLPQDVRVVAEVGPAPALTRAWVHRTAAAAFGPLFFDRWSR